MDIGAFELQGGNRGPRAVADAIVRYSGRSVSVTESTLLANDSDPELDVPLTVIAVGTAASGQATVSRANGYVFYDPAPGLLAETLLPTSCRTR